MVTKRLLSFLGTIVFFSSFFCGLDAMQTGSNYTSSSKMIADRRKEMFQLLKQQKALKDSDATKNKDEIDALQVDIDALDAEITDIGKSRGTHDWLARALAGKENLDFLNGAVVKSTGDAFLLGLKAQGAGALGNFMSTKMKKTMDTLFGGIWDWCVIKLTKLFSSEKFDISLLTMWQVKFVDKLDVINAITGKGFGDTMRLMDQTSRQYDDSPAQTGGTTVVTQVDEVWKSFVNDTISDYNVFIAQVQSAREDYEEDDPIITYLDSIGQMLKLIFIPLSKSTSLRDFDNKLGANKSCIIPVKNSVLGYFKQVCDIIKTRTQLMNQLAPTQSTPSQPNSYRGYAGDTGYSSQPFSQQV